MYHASNFFVQGLDIISFIRDKIYIYFWQKSLLAAKDIMIHSYAGLNTR
jgi:hypothetical protein